MYLFEIMLKIWKQNKQYANISKYSWKFILIHQVKIISIFILKVFFEEGKINNITFLVPVNVNKKVYEKFDKIIKVINKVTEDLINVQTLLNHLNQFKRIKIIMAEKNQEFENSSDSNNNEEPKEEKIMKILW